MEALGRYGFQQGRVSPSEVDHQNALASVLNKLHAVRGNRVRMEIKLGRIPPKG
jgi:hypothetical protein